MLTQHLGERGLTGTDVSGNGNVLGFVYNRHFDDVSTDVHANIRAWGTAAGDLPELTEKN
jgi:hypothetical protein